jgi:hypothetical protein
MRGRREANVQLTWIAEHIAEVQGWDCPEGTAARSYLEVRLARGQLEWARRAKAEYSFDPIVQLDAYFSPDHARVDAEVLEKARESLPVPILGLFEDYARETRLAPATLKAWKACLQALVDHLGHDDAARVSRADIIGWKDALLRAPDGRLLRSQKTVSSKYLASVRTIFGWAERNLRIAENPASKVDVVVPKKVQLREEKGLNDAEASVILKAALVAEPDLRSPLRGFGRRWVPWICAYTGARVGEITQMRAEDVFRHSSGVQCIRITPEAGSQKGTRLGLRLYIPTSWSRAS